ncbi:MAG: cupin domain-containing protein, partial [Hydrogenophilaceae bacterium]|nr:cupin domain-containing protein [Hydrogenophilaceae bacterium]
MTIKTHPPYPIKSLLGGLSPGQFMAEYWQKKPLLVRQALPGFQGLLDKAGLLDLAGREDAESRLVLSQRKRWQLAHGPFEREELQRLPARGWSLLVQGVNHFLPEADRLLRSFNFVPYTRLDDLMVSFAPPGGGVGPHFDSYDVFLIQGLGRRRWEISAQDDLTLVEGAPLRILKHFQPEQSWELEPGDMLYLPPKYAHNGIALSDCMTYSVGFRAPSSQEIAGQFLGYLQDQLQLEGIYADPDLQPTRHPGRIGADLVARLTDMIQAIRWNQADIRDFAGRYLSEPKPYIFFEPPARPLSPTAFAKRIETRGARLDPKTLLLYQGRRCFINGEPYAAASSATQAALRDLADRRELGPGRCDTELIDCLYDWYRAGFVHPGA